MLLMKSGSLSSFSLRCTWAVAKPWKVSLRRRSKATRTMSMLAACSTASVCPLSEGLQHNKLVQVLVWYVLQATKMP